MVSLAQAHVALAGCGELDEIGAFAGRLQCLAVSARHNGRHQDLAQQAIALLAQVVCPFAKICLRRPFGAALKPDKMRLRGARGAQEGNGGHSLCEHHC
ncbi:hypothetical protein D3C85_1448760 [compost metagenome]